jgi:hypothetical protein
VQSFRGGRPSSMGTSPLLRHQGHVHLSSIAVLCSWLMKDDLQVPPSPGWIIEVVDIAPFTNNFF